MPENIAISTVTLGNFLFFILIFLITLVVGNFISLVIRRMTDERVPLRSAKLLARMGQYLIFIIGMYYGIYHILQLDLKALVASLGILSLAIAFSSQQVIQNFLAGIIITSKGMIKLEDWVELGTSGMSKVKDMSLTHTTLRNVNGKIIYLPNSAILTGIFTNYTRSGFIELTVPITFPADRYEKVKEIALEAAHDNERILPSVSKKERKDSISLLNVRSMRQWFDRKPNLNLFSPTAYITDISNGKVILSLRLWVRAAEKKDEIVSEYLEELKKRLEAKKIALV